MYNSFPKIVADNSKEIGSLFNSLFSSSYGDETNFKVTDTEIVVTVDLPGVTKEAVQIDFQNQELKVTARREDKKFTYDFKWKVYCPILEANIQAKLDLGVLTLTLPKTTKEIKKIRVD
jgi:HSP20 family protein